MKLRSTLAMLCLAASTSFAQAATYFENFDAPFPQWESGWLGQNSNLTNLYGVGAGRGNNPDGLWIGETTIHFKPELGKVVELSFDIGSYSNAAIQYFDASNNLLGTSSLAALGGVFTKPGVYQHFSIQSAAGIASFSFVGDWILGYVSIDNVSVTTAVPEPGSFAMLIAGLGLLGVASRRRNRA